MRPTFWRAVLPLALVVALLLGACGEDSDDGDATPADGTPAAAGTSTPVTTQTPEGDLTDEQVFNSRLQGEPVSLDPQRATDTHSISVMRSLYSTLVRIDENQEVVPDVAEEVPTVENGGISEDGLTYTFRLREGLMWDDGTPLVAQAFVDGAKRLFEPGAANYYSQFYRVIDANGANQRVVDALAEGMEGEELEALEQEVVDNLQVTAPDDRTVVYRLSRPSPVFPLLATMWPLFPVRQDLIDQHGDAWTEAGNFVSNGPFKLTEWTHNESIVLERNDHWHGEEVALERINIDIIEDDNIAFLAYQEGELDAVTLGPEQLVQVRNMPEIQDQFQAYAQLSTIGIYFNFRSEDLQEQGVRQALAAAIDREEYAEVVREGVVLPAYSWVPPGMPGHDPEAGLQYQDAEEQAVTWLEEAGYPGGEGLTITILTSNTTVSELTAAWLKEQWETKLGITVDIETLESATYFERRNAGDYEVTTGGWGADYPDPHNWMPLWETGAGLNSGNYSNPEFDALVQEAETELDNERRIDLYMQSQEIMLEDMAFAPLYFGRRNILVQPWVKNLIPSSIESNQPGDMFFHRIFIEGRE